MLKIAVFGFYGPDHDRIAPPGRDVHLSPVTTQDFMRLVWEIEPPASRIGDAPDTPGFVKLTTVTRQPVYVQSLHDDMASSAGQLNCDGYIAIVDAVKILAPRTIQNALRRLYELHPTADLIIAAARQNEPDALSSDEIRAILGLNPALPVMPFVPSEPKTVHRLIRRLVGYIDNPDRIPPPIFAGESPPVAVTASAGERPAPDRGEPPRVPRIHGLDHVAIGVSDLERALAFYQGVLGFRLLGHIDLPDDERGRTLTHLDTGRGVLELVHDARAPAHPSGPPNETQTGAQHIALRVTDLDAIVRTLLGAGVHVTRQPVRAAGGARVACLADPDGTPIELIEGEIVYSRR